MQNFLFYFCFFKSFSYFYKLFVIFKCLTIQSPELMINTVKSACSDIHVKLPSFISRDVYLDFPTCQDIKNMPGIIFSRVKKPGFNVIKAAFPPGNGSCLQFQTQVLAFCGRPACNGSCQVICSQ